MSPIEVLPMGNTELPEELIDNFVDDNRASFTSETYDLLTHNCNNFSEEFVNFLTGNDIPEKILNLPQVYHPLFFHIDPAQHTSGSDDCSFSEADGSYPSDSAFCFSVVFLSAPVVFLSAPVVLTSIAVSNDPATPSY